MSLGSPVSKKDTRVVWGIRINDERECMMRKDGGSPQSLKYASENHYTDNQRNSSNVAAVDKPAQMDTANAYSSRNGTDSMSENSSDCSYPAQSTTIPTCVVAPTSSEPDDYIPSRKQREFIPENKKDDHYWEKRRKNNDAARRSREKRRFHDMALENRIVDLTRDNCALRNELFAIKKRFGLPLNETFLGDDDVPSKRPVDTSHSPSSGNNQGGMSPGKQTLPPGYVSGAPGRGQMPVSVPPPLLHVPGGLPVGINFGVNGPMPLFVTVPTSEDMRTNVPSQLHSSSSYREPDDIEDQPPPAHSQRLKREPEENVYGAELAPYYTAAGGNDAPESPVSFVSTSLHSSAASYSKSLTSAAHSSVSIKSKTSMDYSDDNSTQEEPLSLTVNKSHGTSGNESSNSTSSGDSVLSQSPPATALPHKLRHKSPSEYGTMSQSAAFANPLINGLAQLSEIALAQSGPLPLLKSPSGRSRQSHKHNPRSHIDPKYAERRRRNNEAARKCRENRKCLTQIREAKSEYLAGENGKLRDELDELQEEMKKLKEMLEKKRNNAQENSGGESSP